MNHEFYHVPGKPKELGCQRLNFPDRVPVGSLGDSFLCSHLFSALGLKACTWLSLMSLTLHITFLGTPPPALERPKEAQSRFPSLMVCPAAMQHLDVLTLNRTFP